MPRIKIWIFDNHDLEYDYMAIVIAYDEPQARSLLKVAHPDKAHLKVYYELWGSLEPQLVDEMYQ